MLTAYGESCKQKEHCSRATVPVVRTVASGITGTVIHFGMVINDGAPESSIYKRHSGRTANNYYSKLLSRSNSRHMRIVLVIASGIPHTCACSIYIFTT